jgi:hypothetical protein
MTAYEQTMQGFVERIEALEVKQLHVWERLERLEKRRAVQEKSAKDVEEYARQDRWYATFNAVLPTIAATAVDHGMTAAECVHDATLYADAAHGPLEQEP